MKSVSGKVKGSLTIEAALGLTIFIFTVICLIMPMKMLNTQRQVQMVLETTAKELSQYAYIRYRMSMGENEIGENRHEMSEELVSLFTGTAAGVYLSGKIREVTGNGRIESMDFSKTELSENGETIHLEVQYRLKLPFSIFLVHSVPAVSRSVRRGWIGSDGGRFGEKGEGGNEDDKTVYVGNSMGRYHLSKNCHYLSNDIITISGEDIEDYKSISGAHYKPCSVCKKGLSGSGSVYVMPNGAYYHSSKSCSSIAYYIRAVPLSEVKYLGECSYCGRKKGNP